MRQKSFATEEDLREHAMQLNDNGMHANVSIMDANGIAVLACLAGCYADEFYYYAPCEDGYMHCANGECCQDCAKTSWKPTFPVTALVHPDPCDELVRLSEELGLYDG